MVVLFGVLLVDVLYFCFVFVIVYVIDLVFVYWLLL